MKTLFKKSNGFGILEVLMAGVVLIIVLGALVMLARTAIKNSQYMQERAQATNLASEGIEIVRQIRDSNLIDGNSLTGWNTMENQGVFKYDVDYYVTFNTDASDPDLGHYRLVQGAYDITKIDNVSFLRKIKFYNIANYDLLMSPTDVSNDGKNGAIVEATVSWSSAPTHSITIRELITNSRFVF